jgi:hypothetical protein
MVVALLLLLHGQVVAVVVIQVWVEMAQQFHQPIQVEKVEMDSLIR